MINAQSVKDLCFNRDKHSVEYAFYKSGENQRIGYIRFQPKVVKTLCKSKQYNLVSQSLQTHIFLTINKFQDFLVITGSVTFVIDKIPKVCQDGDLCTVPKSKFFLLLISADSKICFVPDSKYEIRNNSSDDIAMVMIVKPIV